MLTASFEPELLRQSVIAVPPLARDASFEIDCEENAKLIHHLESGGIRTLLYGGNAVLYHARLSEYERLLHAISESSSDETTVVPSFGPSYGLAMDQSEILREHNFPTAMLLPARDVVDEEGIATGVRRIAEDYGKPVVLYLKFDRWLSANLIKKLEADGAISWIKYAVVRDDPAKDDYLREVLDIFPSERVVSGIGEQPAIVHLRDFGITGFTSGCVCIAPQRSTDMLAAIQKQDFRTAESIRQWFEPLEDLRNRWSPIRVLHHAVTAVGIADCGPIQPMLSELSESQRLEIANVALEIFNGQTV